MFRIMVMSICLFCSFQKPSETKTISGENIPDYGLNRIESEDDDIVIYQAPKKQKIFAFDENNNNKLHKKKLKIGHHRMVTNWLSKLRGSKIESLPSPYGGEPVVEVLEAELNNKENIQLEETGDVEVFVARAKEMSENETTQSTTEITTGIPEMKTECNINITSSTINTSPVTSTTSENPKDM